MAPRVDKKICGICKKVIFIPGEEYCILAQYKQDNKLQGQGHYHVQCFKEKYLLNNSVNTMLDRTNKLLAKAEGIYS